MAILGQKRALWLAVLVLLLGSTLRMAALEQSPSGFSLDEACESYDAYSLWHTGRDQHGVFLPTVLRSFGGCGEISLCLRYRDDVGQRVARVVRRLSRRVARYSPVSGHDVSRRLTRVQNRGPQPGSVFLAVSNGLITRPLSIMAHLLTSEGEILGVDDRLGVSPLELAAGDVVVQRHRFAVPPGSVTLRVRVGAYWLDTMERWAVPAVPGADALFIALAER